MVKHKDKKSQNSKEQTNIYDTWAEFSNDISDRINEITKEEASEYKELYKIWSECAQKMTEQMTNFSPDESTAFEHMQKVWTEYSGKIGERFGDILGKENGPLKELYQLWTDYSGKMSDRLSEMMTENIKNQRELYELWMDAFGIKDKGFDEEVSGAFEGTSRFWLEMWDRSKDMFQPLPETDIDFNTKYNELNEFLTKNYSKMVMNIMRSPAFAKLNGNILDNNLEMIRLNDQYMNQYLGAMGLPTKENMDEIYLKLHDIDKKLSEISRAIKSQKITDKK